MPKVILMLGLALLVCLPVAQAEEIDFEPYRTYEAHNLEIAVDVPKYMGDPTGDLPGSWTIVFQEPEDGRKQEGFTRVGLTISRASSWSTQTRETVEEYYDTIMEAFKEEWYMVEPEEITETTLMGKEAYEMPYHTTIDGAPYRGRIIVAIDGKTLYMIRSFFPEENYDAYDAGIMQVAIDTLKIL